MNALVRYEAARLALAEAHAVDEVKEVRDVGLALQAYARQSKDTELIDRATDIRLRAERRLGEMLREQKETIGLATGGEHGGRKRKDGSREEPSNPRPTLAEAGIDKKLSSRAQKLAALPPDDFEARVAAAKLEAVKSVELPRAARAAEKKERRTEREAELGRRQTTLPTKRFGVLYVDPPWRFEVWSRETGLENTSPDNHYPTLNVDAIKAIDVPSIVADDAVMFLWTTVPLLPQSIETMSLWGFEYVSLFGWVKNKAGTGYWVRNRLELLLIGKRGDIPAPAPGTQFDSVIEAPVGRHSAKPAVVRSMIESMFPSLPKLEMFARGAAPDGWTFWGNQAEDA
jgi:N6-adenosine-specific RNA methylase IME4